MPCNCSKVRRPLSIDPVFIAAEELIDNFEEREILLTCARAILLGKVFGIESSEEKNWAVSYILGIYREKTQESVSFFKEVMEQEQKESLSS
jgi:hypothetical protein